MSGLSEKTTGWKTPFTLAEGGLHVHLNFDYEANKFRETPITTTCYKPEKVIAARDKIADMFTGLEPIEQPTFNFDEVYHVVSEKFHKTGTLEGLETRAIKRIPWIMYDEAYPDPKNTSQPLAANKQFLMAYIHAIAERSSCNLKISLARVFLYFYPQKLSTFSLLVEKIPELLTSIDIAKCRAFATLASRYQLFAPNAPKAFWNKVTDTSKSIEEQLSETGFTALMGSSRFLQVAFQDGLVTLRNKLESGDAASGDTITKLDTFLATETGRSLRNQHRALLADSILLPFLSANVAPGLQPITQSLMLKHYSDPRINRSEWNGVDQRAVQIMKSWLIKDSLDFFFKLLEGIVQGTTATQHWKYRQAFWRAYLEKEVIKDAWVILSPHLYEKAKHVEDFNEKTVGIVSSVTAEHACLLMRIGNLVIIEWNHNGSCHIISNNADRLPEFYKKYYLRDQLESKTEQINKTNYTSKYRHSSSERYLWQKNIASTIEAFTGVQLRLIDYYA